MTLQLFPARLLQVCSIHVLNHLPLFRIKSELLTSDLANECCIPGDELVACDGQRLTVDNVQNVLAGDDLVGSTVDLVVRKHGTGVEVYVPLKRILVAGITYAVSLPHQSFKRISRHLTAPPLLGLAGIA